MAKRYYISPVIGDGLTPATAYRAKLADTVKLEPGAGLVAVIPTNASGAPLFNWAICRITATNHVALGAVPDVNQFPDITLDSQLSVLTTPQRNALLNFLSNRGVSTTGLNSNSTFRDVVNRVGQFLHSQFDANNFDVN